MKTKKWEILAYYPQEKRWKVVETVTDRKLAARTLDKYIEAEPFTMFKLEFLGEVES